MLLIRVVNDCGEEFDGAKTHRILSRASRSAWIAGSSPAMTMEFEFVAVRQQLSRLSPTDLIRGSMLEAIPITKQERLSGQQCANPTMPPHSCVIFIGLPS